MPARPGINLVIAKNMATLGANLSVISRDPAEVEAAVARLGANAVGRAADVRDYGEVAVAIDARVARFGLFDIVLLGNFHAARAAFANMRKPGASLTLISAFQSFVAYPHQVHASAGKAGNHSMMPALVLIGPGGGREFRRA